MLRQISICERKKKNHSFLFTAVLLVFLRPSPGDCDTMIVVTVVEEWKRRKYIIVLESEPYAERSYALFFFFSVELVSDRRTCDIDEPFVQELSSRRVVREWPLASGKPHRNTRSAQCKRWDAAARQRGSQTEHKCTAATRSTSGFQTYVRVTAMYLL